MKRYMVADAEVIAVSDTFTFCEESEEAVNRYGLFHNALKGFTVFEDTDSISKGVSIGALAFAANGISVSTGVYTLYGGTWQGEYPAAFRTHWLAPGIPL